MDELVVGSFSNSFKILKEVFPSPLVQLVRFNIPRDALLGGTAGKISTSIPCGIEAADLDRSHLILEPSSILLQLLILELLTFKIVGLGLSVK